MITTKNGLLSVEFTKDYYKLGEIAALLNCKPSNLSMLQKLGKFIEFSFRKGNGIYYKREDLEKWLENSYKPQMSKHRKNLKEGAN